MGLRIFFLLFFFYEFFIYFLSINNGTNDSFLVMLMWDYYEVFLMK